MLMLRLAAMSIVLRRIIITLPGLGGQAVAAILTLGDGMAMLEIWDAKCTSSVPSKIC